MIVLMPPLSTPRTDLRGWSTSPGVDRAAFAALPSAAIEALPEPDTEELPIPRAA